MQNASKRLYSNWSGLFQTAIFSFVGFSGTMMMSAVGDLADVYPWF